MTKLEARSREYANNITGMSCIGLGIGLDVVYTWDQIVEAFEQGHAEGYEEGRSERVKALIEELREEVEDDV